MINGVKLLFFLRKSGVIGIEEFDGNSNNIKKERFGSGSLVKPPYARKEICRRARFARKFIVLEGFLATN